MFNVTEMFRVPHELLHNLHVLAVAFEECRVCVPERMPAEVAHDSDFFRRRLQVRLVKRTWPIRQFPTTVWTGENPVLVGGVGTLQPPRSWLSFVASPVPDVPLPWFHQC